MRITDEMFNNRVKAIEDYMREYGLLEGEEIESKFQSMQKPHLILQKGSPTYGNAWRIFATGGSYYQSGHYDPLHLTLGYLGWTRSEAWQTLSGIYNTFGALSWKQQQEAYKAKESENA